MAIKKVEPDLHYEGVPDEAILTRAEILAIIGEYENQFGMTSDEFRKRWQEGSVPDVFETNSWAMLLKYL